MNRFMFAALAVIGALVVSTAGAQDSTKPKMMVVRVASGDVVLSKIIRLEVIDVVTGAELAGVEVSDALSGNHVTTTPEAKLVDLYSFILASPFSPRAVLTVRKPGYAPQTFALNLTKDTSDRTVALERRPLGTIDSAVVLPGVVSRGAPTFAHLLDANILGFNARRDYPGFDGIFVDSSVLKNAHGTLFDVLENQGKSFAGKVWHCYPVIYVDGVQNFQDPDLWTTASPSQFVAVEYYKDARYAPETFKGKSCGSLVLWTIGS